MVQGEVIIDLAKAPGRFITRGEADMFYSANYDYMLQMGDDQFYALLSGDTLDIPVNHSCVPNCGIRESLQIIAMRAVEPGEEMTFDYAMSESSDFIMDCLCQDLECRKIGRASCR